MYTEKDRTSTNNSLERIEENYRDIYMHMANEQVSSGGLVIKLNNELTKHDLICDKLFSQRFSTSKYEDKWMDELFKEYQLSKSRIGVLIEIITS